MSEELQKVSVDEVMKDIQPHFLFNALNAIVSLCETNPKNAETSIIEFSKFLRNNLNTLGKTEPVPFEQELEHVRSYLALEMIRFPDKITVSYSIDDENFSLPAMTLVPLVKNCIRHGLEQNKDTIAITISSFLRGETNFVSITDDGCGFDTSVLNQPHDPPNSIAVITSRLYQQSGGNIDISSTMGKGTEVLIMIPARG